MDETSTSIKTLSSKSKNNKNIITGIYSKSADSLWDIKLPIKTAYPKNHHAPAQLSANIMLRTDKKSTDLICTCPVFHPQTHFLQAIKNNFFKSWPDLTYQLITKNSHPNIYTVLVHIRQEHPGLRSTKTHSNHFHFKNIANEIICTLLYIKHIWI